MEKRIKCCVCKIPWLEGENRRFVLGDKPLSMLHGLQCEICEYYYWLLTPEQYNQWLIKTTELMLTNDPCVNHYFYVKKIIKERKNKNEQ
jgi:hypothetical protein